VADLISKLDEVTELVEAAKSMPLSSSCVVNRAELLAALDEVRDLLPQQIADASGIVADRDELVEEARREAERIVEAATQRRSASSSRPTRRPPTCVRRSRTTSTPNWPTSRWS
jgi:G3E family GTPase